MLSIELKFTFTEIFFNKYFFHYLLNCEVKATPKSEDKKYIENK